MKNIILTIFAFAAIAIGTVACSKCNTSNIKIGVGTITGIDGTMCTCCGGYIIKMNNQTY